MKTTVRIRLARLAGLVLLSLLVIATGVRVAQAATAAGPRGGGGIAAAPFASASDALAALSGTSSMVAWIIVGSAFALLVFGLAAGAWVRRRREHSEPLSVVFCARHPEHTMCETD